MVPSAETRRFTVPAELDGSRLDRTLAQLVEGWSRSRLAALVRSGAVRVDGEPATRASSTLAGGAEVEVDLPPPTVPTDTAGRAIADLDVIFEDDALIVIDKPAGLVVHPNARSETGTVADLAVARFGELPRVQGDDRPGIVHRLDRLTSGVMLLARTEAAALALKAQFQARTVEKTYLAIVHASPRFDSDWLEGEIAPSPKNPDRFQVVPEGEGREASTYIECRERFHGFSFFECRPKTGRTHQIRVHLTHAGHPVVGDRKYKIRGAAKVPLPTEAPPVRRQALHAHAIAIDHPVTGERVRFEAPLPADMVELLDWLRANMPDRGE